MNRQSIVAYDTAQEIGKSVIAASKQALWLLIILFDITPANCRKNISKEKTAGKNLYMQVATHNTNTSGHSRKQGGYKLEENEVGDNRTHGVAYNLNRDRTKCIGVLPCEYGGHTDPNNCTKCVCPEGRHGRYCELKTGQYAYCKPFESGPVRLRDARERCINGVSFYNGQQSAMGSLCDWTVQAPAGCRIRAVFKKPFGVYHSKRHLSCHHWAEVKYRRDFNRRGSRFCCRLTPIKLISAINKMTVSFNAQTKIPSEKQSTYHARKMRTELDICFSIFNTDCLASRRQNVSMFRKMIHKTKTALTAKNQAKNLNIDKATATTQGPAIMIGSTYSVPRETPIKPSNVEVYTQILTEQSTTISVSEKKATTSLTTPRSDTTTPRSNATEETTTTFSTKTASPSSSRTTTPSETVSSSAQITTDETPARTSSTTAVKMHPKRRISGPTTADPYRTESGSTDYREPYGCRCEGCILLRHTNWSRCRSKCGGCGYVTRQLTCLRSSDWVYVKEFEWMDCNKQPCPNAKKYSYRRYTKKSTGRNYYFRYYKVDKCCYNFNSNPPVKLKKAKRCQNPLTGKRLY